MSTVQVSAEPAGDGWVCEVDVEDRGLRTHHTVTVRADDLERWGAGDVEDLVRRSFAFLLQRENATSILRRFDLSVIPSYFAEYDREIRASGE